MKKPQIIIAEVMSNKLRFLAAFFCIFTFSYGILYAVDFYPEPKTTPSTPIEAPTSESVSVVEEPEIAPVTEEVASSSEVVASVDTLPNSLFIPSLKRTVDVLNPAANSVAALDAALLKGVIRHPDSATFGEEGNMLILGHSSYLPTVHNKNFQALNGIQNLKWGDTIVLSSNDTEYTYKVEKSYKAKATGFTVPVAGKGKKLMLVTCNNFATADDRYIVEATLQSTKKL
jgi:LPXTG-site transpeptidase (sortase) family protein